MGTGTRILKTISRHDKKKEIDSRTQVGEFHLCLYLLLRFWWQRENVRYYAMFRDGVVDVSLFPCCCVQRPNADHRNAESPKCAGRCFGILTSACQFSVPQANRNFQSSKKKLMSQFSKCMNSEVLQSGGKMETE